MKRVLQILLLTLILVPIAANASERSPVIISPGFLSKIMSGSTENKRVISIVGEITEDSVTRNIAKLEELDRASNDEIEIDITSIGGNVYAGIGLIDAMQLAHSPIKTVCKGYCMSMGAGILVAGTPGRRFSQPHATILLHQVSSGAQGTLAEMQNSVAESARMQALMDSIFTKATGLDEKTLTIEMNHDNFMSAQRAKELHIIDEILK